MKSLLPWKKREMNHAAPVRWDDWMSRWWENPFKGLLSGTLPEFENRMPAIDVTEDKRQVNVKAEIPGMSEKDIQLTWHEGTLYIRGEKKNEKEEKKGEGYYHECSYGSFSRSIPLGNDIQWDKAHAKYKNGVLTVELPKDERHAKSIEIKVS